MAASPFTATPAPAGAASWCEGAHRKTHRHQGRQQHHHPQAVEDQHVGGNPRACLLEQAGFLSLDLAEQIGLKGRQAEALIRRREGRGLDGGELALWSPTMVAERSTAWRNWARPCTGISFYPCKPWA